jgi:hypothetical protein
VHPGALVARALLQYNIKISNRDGIRQKVALTPLMPI